MVEAQHAGGPVPTGRVAEGLDLALSAVFSTAEALRYVFIRKGLGFEVRTVEIGIADTRYVEILSGLKVGDEVARTRPLEFEGEVPVLTPTAPVKSKASKKDVDPAAPPPPRSSGGSRTGKSGRGP